MRALIEAFGRLVEKIRGVSHIDKSVLAELSREIQRALLRADVPLDMIKQFTDDVLRRLREGGPPAGIPIKEYLLYVVYEKLVELLGGEFPAEFKPARRPYVVMLVGVEGSGKTTTAAKLAKYLARRGYRVGLVQTDTIRPAAFDQLKQLAESVGVPFYGERDSKSAAEIALRGIEKFRNLDVIILDTAGRHRSEESLMQEIKAMYEAVKPDEVMLVIDATVGKQAAAQAEAFMRHAPVHSVIITKMDSTARGGGALAAVVKTGARVKFVGTGEGVDEIEPFNPRGFVSRLLGMGDFETLVDRVRAALEEDKVLQEVESGRFDLLTFKRQIEALLKLGPLSKLIQLLPGGLALKVSEDRVELSQRNLKKWLAILSSMTREELANPEILNASRIRRVALGAGVTPREVREMLEVYENIKRMTKILRKRLRAHGKLALRGL
ncbi:MAG: signal recognition particle protein Srp54 [Thermoproteaceae archaeon]|nr:signal recognition particle protein Srp54 [Thermoproteaceae archaeon]